MAEPRLLIEPALCDDSEAFKDIPRAAICCARPPSASPLGATASGASSSHMLSLLRQRGVPEALVGNRLFATAVEDLLEGRAVVSDPTLCAAHLLSVRRAGAVFEDWLESSVANHVWRYAHLTALHVSLIEHETQKLLLAWLQRLNLASQGLDSQSLDSRSADRDLQDAVWAVYKCALERRELRRESLYVVLACTIFACAKLFDVDCTFVQIIKASKRDEQVFLRVRLGSGQTGNVLQWYNESFLPSMRKVIVKCKDRKSPFPSFGPAGTTFLSPLVSLSVSPFKNWLSAPPAKKCHKHMVFSRWHEI